MSENRKVFALIGALAIFAVYLGSRLFNISSGGEAVIYFFDVGQGDSQLVNIQKSGPDIQVLIDGGPDQSVLHGLKKVLPLEDRYLDLVVMTHPQLDHFGGLTAVIENYDIGGFITSGRSAESAAFKSLEALLLKKEIPVIVLAEGDQIIFGESNFAVLAPNPDEVKRRDINDASLVMLFRHPSYRALFTGDIGNRVESRLANNYDLRAEILKVPHHGSRFSSSAEFLSVVNPKLAIAGVGKNSYGHPSPEAVRRLNSAGALFYATKDNGLIEVRIENGRLRAFAR